MEGLSTVEACLVGLSGLSWTLVYLITIKKDFADQTYGMPLAALAINFAWEFRYSLFCYTLNDIDLFIQIINTIWCVFDAVIVYTIFKFGPKAYSEEYQRHIGRKTFMTSFLGMLAFCFVFIFVANQALAGSVVCGDSSLECAKFIAYCQNLMMSALFISMNWRRGSMRGQSFSIAFFKWLGTFAVMFEYLPKHPLPLMFLILGTTTILDITYMVMTYKQSKAAGLKLWTNFKSYGVPSGE